jgi:hypothetical protein
MAEKEKAKGPAPDKLDFWDDFAAAGEQRMASKTKVAPEKKEFWDDFAEIGAPKSSAAGGPAAQESKAKSSVGTAALSKRKGAKEGDEWGEW